MAAFLRHGRAHGRLPITVIVLLLAATGCVATNSGPSASPTNSTRKQAGPAAASTTTTRPTPATQAATTTPSTVPPTTGPPTTTLGPVAVVRAYYAAINAHNYAKAWALGGKNLGRSYRQFVRGFADTDHDVLVVLGTSGAKVTVKIVATQDGGQRQTTYKGTYTVVGGQIVAASVRQVSVSPSSIPQPSADCDASYPEVCIPSPPPDLDCGDIPFSDFTVLPPDPHRFDGDQDGIGATGRWQGGRHRPGRP